MSTIADDVIEWFEAHARELPWRKPGTNAWGVLLSEVMSQQTPVARVTPVWEQWMRRWPDASAFAQASPDEVLRAWGKLGYPRRALRLLECARAIDAQYDGRVPSEVPELESLPGIGEYTARAVACFHYGHNVPVVDTNVRRVYGRLIDGTFLAPTASKRQLAQVAALLPTDPHRGPEFSQGFMELGALVCTATSPKCEACPLIDRCAWQAAGCPEPSAAEKAVAKKRVQKFAGTDRQVRGLIMDVLRGATAPVGSDAINVVWPDEIQRERALASLLADGLAVRDDRGLYHLPR